MTNGGDPTSQVVTAKLVGYNGYVGPFTLDTGIAVPEEQSVTLTSNGQFAFEVYGNDHIAPSGSRWRFSHTNSKLSKGLALGVGTVTDVATAQGDGPYPGGPFVPPAIFVTINDDKPAADRLLFWDYSAQEYTFLTAGTGLSIVGTTITATAASGITIGTTAITGGTTGRVLYNNAGVVGELAATTIGTAFLTKTNPSAITFPRANADNTLDLLGASDFRTAIGAGTGSGSVTTVGFTGGIVSIADPTTTPAFTIAGTSGGIPYFSSGTTWATSAALAANSLVIGGGAGVAPSTVTTGTGVLTALGVNIGSAGAPVLFNGALGTPSSGTATNLTGLPVGTGISGLGTGVATFLATPSSANLAAAVTDETGTGALVFATSPTLVTPVLGVATATSINSATINGETGIIIGSSNESILEVVDTTVTFSSGGVMTCASGATLTLAAFDLAATASGNVITTGNLTDITATGTVTSGTWSGSFGAVSGANLTSLNASNISSGTLADARLSANVPLKDAANTFTAAQTLTNNTASTTSSNGALIVTGGIGAGGSINSALNLGAGAGGAIFIGADSSYSTFKVAIGSSGFYQGSEYNLRWSDTPSLGSATITTTLSQKSAGILRIGATADTSTGSLECTNGTLLGTLSVTGTSTLTGGLILPTSTTPASAGAAGVAGTVCRDADYIYVCTATNTWKRVAIATW